MPTRHVITRRGFLRYTAAGVGTIAYAGPLGSIAEAFNVAPPVLSSERQSTLKAIVEALSVVIPEVEPGRADDVVGEAAFRYTIEPPAARQHFDDVLDAVNEDTPGGSFRRLSRGDGVEALKVAARGQTRKEEKVTDDRWVARTLLIQSAIGLAAQPFFSPARPWTVERFPLR